jgi:hypothetical protein
MMRITNRQELLTILTESRSTFIHSPPTSISTAAAIPGRTYPCALAIAIAPVKRYLLTTFAEPIRLLLLSNKETAIADGNRSQRLEDRVVVLRPDNLVEAAVRPFQQAKAHFRG